VAPPVSVAVPSELAEIAAELAEEAAGEQAAPPADEASAEGEAPRGERRRRRGRGRGERDGEQPREPREAQPQVARDQPPRQQPEQPRAREPRPQGDIGTLIRAIEQQQRQIEQLLRDGRGPAGIAAPAGAPPARVGVFVETANSELACDRLRMRFDWGKVLRMLTQDRQLVRALAYSPVHDDPNVSIETQRFVEPFLDRGYKVVTKPLRRFQDGSIKANVDIELALDVISMMDRLDIVVLVSGDGDFQKLVELVQSRGVRCEVAAVGSSTATNLKHAADLFIDLASKARDLRP
jgi:uncharacterized LabA/DUF88 family protein